MHHILLCEYHPQKIYWNKKIGKDSTAYMLNSAEASVNMQLVALFKGVLITVSLGSVMINQSKFGGSLKLENTEEVLSIIVVTGE